MRAQDRASGPLRKLKAQVGGVNKSIQAMGKSVARINPIMGLGGGGLAFAAIKTGIAFNAMKEIAELAFTTLLGDGGKARDMIAQILDISKKTPFSFEDLTRASQRMLAFGFKAEDVLPTLTAVGDAVAAMGGGADMIDRVTMALGQMQTKGKVSGDEMMQLAEAGIPAWQILAENVEMISPKLAAAAKAAGWTQQQIIQRLQKMGEAGKLPAAAAIAALRKGMQTKFGGLGEKQAKTVVGATSSFMDSLKQLLSEFTEGPFKEIAGALLAIGGALDAIGTAFKDLPEPIKTIVSWVATFLVALGGIALAVAGAGGILSLFGAGAGLAGVLGSRGAFLASAASPFAILAAAVLIAKLAWDRNFQPILDAVAAYLTTFPHIKIALSWANEQAKAVADWIMGLGKPLAAAVKIAVEWANAAARDLAAWVGAAAKSVTQTVKVAVEWASQAAIDLVAWVKGTAVSVTQTVKVAYEWASQMAYTLAMWVQAKIGDFAQTVSVAWEWLNTTAYDLATWVADKIGDFAQTVKTAWEWASNGAYGLATWVADKIGTFIQTIQTAWEFASANAGIVAAWIFDQIGTFSQTIQTTWEWASEFAKTLATWVVGKIGVFGTTLKIDFQWVSDAARKIYEWWTGTGANIGRPVLVGGGGGPTHMAAGGIVTSPTLAMIGEAGPEAVVPLGRGGFGGGALTININAPVYGVDQLEDVIRRAIDRSRQRGGVG